MLRLLLQVVIFHFRPHIRTITHLTSADIKPEYNILVSNVKKHAQAYEQFIEDRLQGAKEVMDPVA